MFAPYRTPAKPEPERPEEADAYEAALRAHTSRARRVGASLVLGLVALPIALISKTPAHPAGRGELVRIQTTALANARETIEAARVFTAREQAMFASAVGAVLDTPDLVPSSEPAVCQVPLPDAPTMAGARTFPLVIVAKGDRDRDLPSPSLAAMVAKVNRADEHLRAGRTMEAIVDASALALSERRRLQYDVVLVTTEMKHPIRTTPMSFEPGTLTGRAYVYDFEQHQVTCAGAIHATSSTQVEYSYASTSPSAAMDEGPRLTASLDDDLDRQIRRAITTATLVRLNRR